MLDLSIIIVGYKTRGLIKNCLNSIYSNLANSKLNYKIVIVDNNSQDGTVELIRDKFPEIELIVLDKNKGYSKAVNKGIRKFEAKYYFVLNPDTLFVQENIIDRLHGFMETNTEVGLAGPKLVNPDGSIQMSCCRFPSFFLPIYRRTALGKIRKIAKKIDTFLMKSWDHGQTSFVDWVIGTGMFVRHEALAKAGLMDERFFMYFEDTDWCRRFWESGWKVCYVADIEIIHYHGRPSLKSGGITDLFFNKGTRIHIASWLKYFLKNIFKSKINHNTMEQEKQNELLSFDSEQFDVARSLSDSSKKTKNKNKTWSRFIFGGVLIIIAILAMYFLSAFIQAKKYATAAKADIEMSYQNFITLKFDDSNANLESSRKNIKKAQKSIVRLKPLTFITLTKNNYQAVNLLLSSISDFTHTFEIVNGWAKTNITPIMDSSAGSISQMNTDDKERVLKSISEINPTLNDVYESVKVARNGLSEMPTRKVYSMIRDTADDFDAKLERMENSVLLAQDVLPVMVTGLGYPEAKNYLFLLQNNGEMRATGGYLGTYGVFEIESGEFVEFNTGNTYHLDMDNMSRLSASSPAPIRKYMGTSKWNFRDANWSPDLPTSSLKIEEIYKLESQDDKDIDGLVLMDPLPIVELLAITGSITVDDVTFDSLNFIEELERYTYDGFVQEGVSSRDRKELIGAMGVKMLDYFFNSSLDKWANVWNIVNDNLDKKHIMLNLKDEKAQDFMSRHDWDNRVKTSNGDFLMVIDSSMGSLKTDRFTNKEIKYSVSFQDGKFIGQVNLNYDNTATKSEKTQTLREYTRVYVPEGAELIEVIGSDESVDTYNELDKTAFGTFWTVPIGQSRELIFKYELPSRLFEANQYSLLTQKQAGTIDHKFEFNFDFENIKEVYQTICLQRK